VVSEVAWGTSEVVQVAPGDSVLTLWFDGGLQWIPCRRVRLRGTDADGRDVTYRARWLNFLVRPCINVVERQ
jgi:hypothetical protein